MSRTIVKSASFEGRAMTDTMITPEMLEARDEVEDITARAEALPIGMAKYFVPDVRLLLSMNDALTAAFSLAAPAGTVEPDDEVAEEKCEYCSSYAHEATRCRQSAGHSYVRTGRTLYIYHTKPALLPPQPSACPGDCKRGDGIVCPDDNCDIAGGVLPRHREVLLFTSYCGDDNPECSAAKPCPICLGMSNVYTAVIDEKNGYRRQFAPEWNGIEALHSPSKLRAQPSAALPGKDVGVSYARIIEVVNNCVDRMRIVGESHEMLAKWISEGLNPALVSQPHPWGGRDLDAICAAMAKDVCEKLVGKQYAEADLTSITSYIRNCAVTGGLATHGAGTEGWQPIEIAPHDGSSFLVWTGEELHITHWNVTANALDAFDPALLSWLGMERKPPLCWAPLPEPPLALLAQQEGEKR